MGASLLTCCELLEVAWISLVNLCCRHRRRTQRTKSGAATNGKKNGGNDVTVNGGATPKDQV